jgi:tryptophanyl-tRNA synthetase
MGKKRVLTGDRPTGRLHLGHYVGSLTQRVLLQDEYECYFIIADFHVLTTNPGIESVRRIPENIREMVLDYLSVGIDPDKSVIYIQSQVPEVSELALLFNMLVTVPRVQRIPTLKEVTKTLHIENPSLGLLAYPVLQAADILMVRAHLVPVGKDQEPHIELTREIARRFNTLYGHVFPEPNAGSGDLFTLVGTDGQAKMSKSLDNAIFLSDPPEEVERKVMTMYTDPTRIHATDPGHVEGNPVFIYHRRFNDDKGEVAELEERYRKGTVGDVEVKKRLILALNRFLEPIRDKRAAYEKEEGLVEDIVTRGTRKAREEARATLAAARKAMGLNYFQTG